MRPPFALLLVLTVAGCGDFSVSRLNPFGGGEPEPVPEAVVVGPVFDRLSSVDGIEIGQAYRGILVQARGVAPLQGYSRAELRLLNEGRRTADGMVELEMVAQAPEAAVVGGGTIAARRMIAAQFVSQDLLGGALGIRIVATDGAISAPLDGALGVPITAPPAPTAVPPTPIAAPPIAAP